MTVPGPTTTRRGWLWLLVVPTVVAVAVLFSTHALGAAWPSASGAALSTWAITGAIVAWLVRRRQDHR